MESKRVLVVGGSGYLGQHLLPVLAAGCGGNDVDVNMGFTHHRGAAPQALLDAPGAVFFTGVGKSGIVARKLAQTLASLGFARAGFLSPVDALHGDIGSVFPGDVLVLLSKSGASDELLALAPCA